MTRKLSFGSIINRSLKAAAKEIQRSEKARQREYAKQEKLSTKINKINSVCNFSISLPKPDIEFLSLKNYSADIIPQSVFNSMRSRIDEYALIETINFLKVGKRTEAISNLLDENKFKYNECIELIQYIENNLINLIRKNEDTWFEGYGEYEFLNTQEIFDIDEDIDYETAKAEVTITCLATDKDEVVSSKDPNVLKTKMTKTVEKLNKNWILSFHQFHEERENIIAATIFEAQQNILKYATNNEVRAFQFEDLFDNTPFKSNIPKVAKPKLELISLERQDVDLSALEYVKPTIEKTNYNFIEKILNKTPLKNKSEEWRKNRFEKKYSAWENKKNAIIKEIEQVELKNDQIKNNYEAKKAEYKKYLDEVAEEKSIFTKNQEELNKTIEDKISRFKNREASELQEYFKKSLELAPYPILSKKQIEVIYNQDDKTLTITYLFPEINCIYDIDKIKYYSSKQEFIATNIKDKEKEKIYNDLLNQTCLRTIYEVFSLDAELDSVNSVLFKGIQPDFDKSTGTKIQKEVLSLTVSEEMLEYIDLSNVLAESCIKTLKDRCSQNA